MKMVQVKDNQIVQYNLPRNGTLSDGRYIFGYYRLAMDILLSEGWLPFEDVIPEYNENQYIIDDGYEILIDKVVKKYKVVDMPTSVEPEEPQPSEIDNKIATLEGAVMELTMILASVGGV